jgi:putative oxygen-independent coproporphyrinogen III oxidase
MPPRDCKQKGPRRPASQAGALYVHVPFCLSKCAYCDFYSIPLEADIAGRYVRAAVRELSLRREQLDTPLRSVFVGGGTPTALGADLLTELLTPLGEWIDADTEFSVEANPGTLDADIPRALAQLGVNRVTLGVQSFDDSELRLLGRIHDAEQARRAVRDVQTAGFDNIGLDLMYGVPEQSLTSWRASLGEAMELGIHHLSCYALSFEPGTPLEAARVEGRVSEVDESLQRTMYDVAREITASAGLEHYEISNFARPKHVCRHNLTYWRNNPYVGIGPGGVSYIGGARAKNLPDLRGYLDALESGRLPEPESERIAGRAEMAETLMLSLRLTQGIDRESFTQRFGLDPIEAFPRTFTRYAHLGAVVADRTHVRLDAEALFVADTVLADLIAEA